MSINEYPKADTVAPERSTTAAISEVHPAMDDTILRNVVFAGIRAKQIEIKDGTAELSNEASALFVSRLSAAVRESIGITHHELDRSRIYREKVSSPVAEYLRELKAATSAIDKKYTHVGGFLGNPVTDVEFGGKDYAIPYRKYEGGAIYVMPNGTREVHGAIYRKYVALGAEAGFLGFPETDEQSTVLGTGRFNHFQGGSIYWTSQTGAWEVHGAIRNKWWQLDGDRSDLGYPISDEEGWTDPGNQSTGRISHFQRGSIVFRWSDSSVQVLHDSVVLATSLSSSSVTCSAELWMNSAGDWRYKGHMHNSGFVGFNVTVVSTPRFQDGSGNIFAVNVERHLDGTTSFGGDRDDDWDQVGSQDTFIRDNWDFIRFAGMKTVMNVDTTFGDIVQLISTGLPIAVGVVILGAIFGGGEVCGPYGRMRRNPQTGMDEPNVSFEVQDKGTPCPK